MDSTPLFKRGKILAERSKDEYMKKYERKERKKRERKREKRKREKRKRRTLA